MNSKRILPIWIAVLTLLVFSSCLPKKEEQKDEASQQPGNGGSPGGSPQTKLQSKYCGAHFIKLEIENGQYNLYVSDLGPSAIPMTGEYLNGILSLSGQVSGMDLMYLGALAGDGTYMSTNLMLMQNGTPVHSIKGLAKAGECANGDIDNLPKIAQNPVDLTQIDAISRFRSSAGHNSTDFTETCRSMKHYFQPNVQTGQTTKIFSPFRAIVVGVYNDDGPIGDDEITNQHITLQPIDHPGIAVDIFHTELTAPLVIGTVVEAGTHIAWADLSRGSGASDFDIAVYVHTAQGVRNASIIDLMTDEAFADYSAWSGLASRNDFKISKDLRDANPLQCAFDSISLLSGHFIDQDNDPLLNLRFIIGL